MLNWNFSGANRYSGDVAGRPASSPAPEIGARLASLRKAVGLSQAALGEAVGIPARSISFYERKAQNIPSGLLARFAEVLGVSPSEILGVAESTTPSKRGPRSDLEKRIEQIRALPKAQQKKIIEVVDAMLAQQQLAKDQS